ncbi:MAG TPA: helicase-related protein [Candidatus Lokiarchaeia archaeon]|nr:helicase-related protein [Candidatus Lokiarchaeia archaeon]
MTEDKVPDLFIVDNNQAEWTVERYLKEFCEISKSMDIATAYFEIGSLLSLDSLWQKLELIRILMGDEVTKRTKEAFEKALNEINTKLDDSIEKEKENNDFLKGVPAIVNAIKKGKIKVKVYRTNKFHAKTYITHTHFEVIGAKALVGSSNFTQPGLTKNVELNIQVQDRSEVNLLQEWYEKHWKEAEDVADVILRTIERHIKKYTPFMIYLKSLYEFFKGHEITESEWEKSDSIIYQNLDQYQKDGYHSLIKISKRYQGALLCDGVGLGKTRIGLMLIERFLLRDNKRVILVVPKSGRKSVWEMNIKKFMPKILNGFLPFKIINHTDIMRKATKDVNWPEVMDNIQDQGQIVIIDEAHHFRNLNTNRYKRFYDMVDNKMMFFLTATPINNSLLDLLHLIELFTRRESNYFSAAPLGIYNLRGHFQKMEASIQNMISGQEGDNSISIDQNEASEKLTTDDLFNAIVVQRSRKYVKESQKRTKEGKVLFPEREPPIVVNYSLQKTYGRLLNEIKKAFDKDNPLLTLAIYYPYAFPKTPEIQFDPMKTGRQKQIVGLIRTLLLKRFESSRKAFESSCEDLLLKLIAFVKKYDPDHLKKWELRNQIVINHIKRHLKERGIMDFQDYDRQIEDDLEEYDDDYLPSEINETVKDLDENEFDIPAIIMETFNDIEQLTIFIRELIDLKDKPDDKLEQLILLLKEDERLKDNKVIIFSEYMATAKYIHKRIESEFDNTFEMDSSVAADREDIIKRFAPYYNESSSLDLTNEGLDEIRILISTDVLSEGLNLQDACFLINYDLHWNPVRLMQRIGRIDRRLDASVEKSMIADYANLKTIRGKIQYWNFLPPNELNQLLSLYEKVTSKTLKISKTFGIQGKKLLTPDDDYDALKDFNETYEGSTSNIETIHLEYQKIVIKEPELLDQVRNLPSKVFSSKKNEIDDRKLIFFCYNLPAKDLESQVWNEEAGFTKWYLYDVNSKKIEEDPIEILKYVKCDKNTKIKEELDKEVLIEIRKTLDKHIKNTYLKTVQAPIGVRAKLKAWMEIN